MLSQVNTQSSLQVFAPGKNRIWMKILPRTTIQNPGCALALRPTHQTHWLLVQLLDDVTSGRTSIPPLNPWALLVSSSSAKQAQ